MCSQIINVNTNIIVVIDKVFLNTEMATGASYPAKMVI